MEKTPLGSTGTSKHDVASSEASTVPDAPAIREDEFLTDWEQGLVGWDSKTDPENPLYAN
jgi:hypothetical protein